MYHTFLASLMHDCFAYNNNRITWPVIHSDSGEVVSEKHSVTDILSLWLLNNNVSQLSP